VRFAKEVLQIEDSADAGEKQSAKEHLAGLPGYPACQTEQEGVRETNNLGAVEDTEAGSKPDADLVCNHPEHEDGLVVAA
jgi:hypothetical protein